jgi:hypothetical protein
MQGPRKRRSLLQVAIPLCPLGQRFCPGEIGWRLLKALPFARQAFAASRRLSCEKSQLTPGPGETFIGPPHEGLTSSVLKKLKKLTCDLQQNLGI